MDTIRQYPRTEAEAFRGADYANAFEGPRHWEHGPGWLWTLGRVALVAVALLLVGLAAGCSIYGAPGAV